MKIFVPGRICLFGEHSDWAGGYRRINAEIDKGYTLICGTDQGIHADVSSHPTSLILSTVMPDGQWVGPYEIPMEPKALLEEAGKGTFWSYAAGVAYQVANHRDMIVAMDFFTVPTLTFRVLYCFFLLEHGRRSILHFNVTENPRSPWIVRQLREAFPESCPYRYAILDRDGKLGQEVTDMLTASGMKPKGISPASPWQNGVAERMDWKLSQGSSGSRTRLQRGSPAPARQRLRL